MPNTPQEIISPMHTVIKLNHIGLMPYAYISTKGIITVLETIGGNNARKGFLRSRYVPKAPIKVATLPKIISGTRQPLIRLLMKQPMVSPGMAAGVNIGNIHNASEKRT